MYFKKYLLLIFVATSFINSYSQSSEQKGKLKAIIADDKKKLLTGVTVSLLNIKDSSVAKFGVTDADGSVIIEEIKSGNYFLKLTYTGFETFFSKQFTIDENNLVADLKELVLVQDTKQLSEVTVVAQ